MEHDPELVAETRAWLAKAANDLRAAEALQAVSPPLLDESAFHCQQAAEKALKALLTWNSRTFRKTHNLEEIGEECLALDPKLRDAIDQSVPLTEYAWRFRYPGDPEGIGAEEAAEAIAAARLLIDAVLCRIPQEAWP
jgi:HEPN domain-containing protein